MRHRAGSSALGLAHMGMSEADTRAKLIDPMLLASGWGESRIQREYPYKQGRVRLVGDMPIRDAPQFVDYVLRQAPEGPMIAIVEAKSEDKGPDTGLQQAIGYARDLGVGFAYSSNGHGIVEHDLGAATVKHLDSFPAPGDLLARARDRDPLLTAEVENRHGEKVPNPLVQPVFVSSTGERLRYYQELAIARAIEQIVAGRSRALLALATGTGKSFLAANLVWKLKQSGYVKKVLFLVDRVSLLNQAYNDFRMFGDARGIVSGANVPEFRDVHFATYQTLYNDASGTAGYKRYDPDYFDLVIIDEAHRSGYGDWRVILEYFEAAFHLGMTATPKRTDSIDTYEYFASENRDAADRSQPAFEYSLGDGIDDGFLATYQVVAVRTNLDAGGLHVADEVAKGADLFVPEDAEVKDFYAAQAFEREIVVEDRTRVLCEHLASKLRTWGADGKSMVFCVTMEHAELVKQTMQNLLGPETGKNLYAVRIVSEEKDAQRLLEDFQRSDTSEPVLATTVDLLTTGVNVPAVRNIVFMKPIGSPTVFKQIIGRGSRLDAATGKEFFRIVDYTGATRLFDGWDVPPGESPEIPGEGEALLIGTVADGTTGDPIEAASLAVLVGRTQRSHAVTDADGRFAIAGLPSMDVTLLVAATGYGRRSSQVLASTNPTPVAIELRPVTEGAGKLQIAGVIVSIAEETTLTLDDSGTQLTVAEYKDMAGEKVRTTAGDLVSMGELWRDPITRRQFREDLRASNVDPALLALVLGRTDADEFDLLANAAFGEQIRTREERAREVEQLDVEFLDAFTPEQRVVVAGLLDKYRLGGVDDVSSAAVFQMPPFVDDFGGVAALAEMFGGAHAVAKLLRSIQEHLYPIKEKVA
jgi:type I restriction enzyme, R subunit